MVLVGRAVVSHSAQVKLIKILHSGLGSRWEIQIECNFYNIVENGSPLLMSSSLASAGLTSEAGELAVTTITENFKVDPSPDMAIVEAAIYKRTPTRIDLFRKSSRLRTRACVQDFHRIRSAIRILAEWTKAAR